MGGGVGGRREHCHPSWQGAIDEQSAHIIVTEK